MDKNQCSFSFLNWYWSIPIIIELIFIIIIVSYEYLNYRNNIHPVHPNRAIIYPFSIVKYINSNLNIDNVLEETIID